MKNPEVKQDRYNPGQHIQDSDGIDYIIINTDKEGALIKEVDNPQRQRRVNYIELDSKFIIDLHEGRDTAVPVEENDNIIYIDPKYLPVIIKKTGAQVRSSVSNIFPNWN